MPTDRPRLRVRSIEDISNGTSSIVGIVPRGEVIRNFVHSGAFDQMAGSAELSLIAVTVNPEIDAALKARYGDVHELVESEEPWIVRVQREIIAETHNRWLWSRAARERSRLRDTEAVTLAERSKRAGKKLIAYPLANRSGLRFLTGLERRSSRRFSPKSSYEDLYTRLNPSLVFNGSHVHSSNATQAVQTAQWMGIPTATFIFSWDNLTSQGRIMLPYDYFLVWNESLKEQLVQMYDWIKHENVFVTGTPQFDFHFRDEYYLGKKEYCERFGIDPGRPFVFYSTGMANHMPGEPEIVEQIAVMLDGLDVEARPQLVVRVYPKDRTGRFEAVRKRRPDIIFPKVEWDENWLTPKAEDSVSLVNAIRHCALGINVASTVSLELCMFDKPVINVGYNPPTIPTEVLSYADYYDFDHYKPVVDSGAVKVARSPDEMRTMIVDALANPGSNAYERRALIGRMFGDTLDGRSGERVAQVLVELAGR